MSIAIATPSPHLESGQAPIRVMIVDDAVVVRGLLARWIEADPGLEVVGSMRSGREAIEQLERTRPDVVILDVDMPDTDGITALPRLLEKKPDLVVIMASTLTRRNAEISLRALSLGAADYIPKPETTREVTTSAAFRRELISKIKALGSRRRRLAARGRVGRPVGEPEPALRPIAGPPLAQDQAAFRLRPFPSVPPQVLLIGASTGGPQALSYLLGQAGAVIDQAPVLVVQHMPPTFTTILGEHLTRSSGRPAAEALDGEAIKPGRIYIAPGGRHMQVARRDGAAVIQLDDGPLVNFCKPAVDPFFSSAAAVWGARVLGIILTGMGSDGAQGAGALVAAGGAVIAQDEESSVVWGMPGAVAHAGLCSAILPLDQIAPRVARLFAGDRT